MTKTNSGLIAYAKAQLGFPYWWGTFGQTGSASLFAAKRRQYPSYYTAGDFKYQYGKRVHDCIGLIKGYLWSDSPTAAPKYNASQDKSASGMYKASKIRGPIGTFDFVPGRLIYKGKDPDHINHVGVYIGGGELIEAKGHAYGVVRGPFKPAEWTFWSQCPFIQEDTKKANGEAEAKEYNAGKDFINGVDLSDIQYANGMVLEDFIEANSDLGFVFIKCSRAANSINASFRPWAEFLHKSGFPWGAYHFLNNDKKKVGAKKEAEFFVEHMRPYIGEAVLALDYEGNDMGFAAGEAYALEWLERVREMTGVSPFIYTSQSVVGRLDTIQKAGFPLWVAKYGKNSKITAFQKKDPDDIGNINPFKSAPIFQYGSKLILPRYVGNLDADVFFGTKEDWKRYAASRKERDMVDVSVKLPRLSRGSKGDAVKVVQTIVGAEADGSFGPKTEEAVKTFQKAHGLTVDGIVGRKTWPALLEVL